jgi:hypothetical protein
MVSTALVSKFRHPFLTRGIVHTSTGAFAVCRGIVEAPDAIGHEFGWPRIDEDPAVARVASHPAPSENLAAHQR